MGAKDPKVAWEGWLSKDIKRYKVSVYVLADGTYEAFPSTATLPPGAARVDPQPSRRVTANPHEGTKVAHKKLAADYPLHIAWGCHLAVEHAKRRLTVHSRDVRDEMARRNLIDQGGGTEHWLGTVFKVLKEAKILKATGHYYKYSDAERNIHDREVKIWGLIENADTTKFDAEPTERPKKG